jgi:hypothetical protein
MTELPDTFALQNAGKIFSLKEEKLDGFLRKESKPPATSNLDRIPNFGEVYYEKTINRG